MWSSWNLDELPATGVTMHDGHVTLREMKMLGEECDQRVVGSPTLSRRSDPSDPRAILSLFKPCTFGPGNHADRKMHGQRHE